MNPISMPKEKEELCKRIRVGREKDLKEAYLEGAYLQGTKLTRALMPSDWEKVTVSTPLEYP
jgi:hypothetical protein